jgi:hypothetical protein
LLPSTRMALIFYVLFYVNVDELAAKMY